MITQYQFSVNTGDDRIPSFWAYRLYSWMLEQLPPEVGEAFHEQGETPLSAFLHYERASGKVFWTVNLLSEESEAVFSPLLDHCAKIDLHTGSVNLYLEQKRVITSPKQLILSSREQNDKRCRTEITFLTPTAFKKEGRYEIFPQMKLILQSLVNKWNLVCPEYPLDDADALEALEQGLHIVDYNLRTTRYPLKNIRIPGFTGTVQIESRLPAPLEELWQMLLSFAPYSGIGVKTTLGMGGVSCTQVIRKPKTER